MKIKIIIYLTDDGYIIRSLFDFDAISNEPIISDGNIKYDWIHWRKYLVLYPNGKESYVEITPSYIDLRNELLKNEI